MIILLILLAIIEIIILLNYKKIHFYTLTNTHDKWEIDALKASIQRFGGTLNVIFTKDEIGKNYEII